MTELPASRIQVILFLVGSVFGRLFEIKLNYICKLCLWHLIE
jgi:hypothetical protein